MHLQSYVPFESLWREDWKDFSPIDGAWPGWSASIADYPGRSSGLREKKKKPTMKLKKIKNKKKSINLHLTKFFFSITQLLETQFGISYIVISPETKNIWEWSALEEPPPPKKKKKTRHFSVHKLYWISESK